MSLRTRAEVIDEKDFSLGKTEQMLKARRLLAADSVDAAFVILNMVVGDVEARKRISREEATAITDAYLMLGEIQSGKQYGKSANYNDYGKAYTCYRKASDMARTYGLTPQLAKALLGLGVKYEVQLSSFDDPLLVDTLLSTLKQSLSLAIESKSWETADMAMKNLASEAFSRGKGNTIRNELNLYYSLPLTDGNVDNNREFVNAFCHTMEALAKKEMDKALLNTQEMKRFCQKITIREIDTYAIRAEILFQTGRLAEAMACLDTVGIVAREVGDLWYDMQIERSKCNLYAALGKKSESDSCLFRYYDLREQLFEDRSANRIKDLHFMSRIDSVTLEMQKITIERQHARMLFGIAMIVVLVFGVMLFMLVRSNRKLRESHRRIYEEYSRRLEREEALSEGSPAMEAISAEPTPSASARPHDEGGHEDTDEKYKSSHLTEQEKDDVYLKLKKVLAGSQAALSSRYQIKDMAAEAGVSARTISQVINERSGGNFAGFLAEHRINTACRRINESPAFRRLTIEAMAASVGIQSRSYFSTTFKRIVGLNPSEYIRQAEKREGQASYQEDE
ncbi:MAG: AraC family transcriptional regulator [Bacteroides sp.]|nr:AraC family transcriptional regulator [Bacteroides sp.]